MPCHFDFATLDMPAALPCPRQINSTEDYEVRRYEAGSWVSTQVEAYAYALGVSKGFQVSSLSKCGWTGFGLDVHVLGCFCDGAVLVQGRQKGWLVQG